MRRLPRGSLQQGLPAAGEVVMNTEAFLSSTSARLTISHRNYHTLLVADRLRIVRAVA